MLDKAYELTMKMFSDKQLTDDESKYLHNRNAKYELVRYLYTEKVRHDGVDLLNFQFSPGDSFMDTPIINFVNGLLEVNEAIKNGDYDVVDFGDSSLVKSNPPDTGKEKTIL